jgi:hypothetical protein
MIDITPSTSAEQEVNVRDEVRLRWRLDAQVDPEDLTFTVLDTRNKELATFSGAEITEERVEDDGKIFFEYAAERTVERRFELCEFLLDDGVQTALDTAKLSAKQRLT